MYRDRHYLPHIESPNGTYFVTFRLAETLPASVLQDFQAERRALITRTTERSIADQQRLKYLESKRIQQYLDKGIGECWLRDPRIANIVKESIQYFDGSRYISHLFCIMPNHVHWLLTPIFDNLSKLDFALISIMHSIKSYSSHEANKLLNRKGRFWSKEYYDHLVRDEEQFERILIYILENPVKAGLCKEWRDWPWTECSEKIRTILSPPEAGDTKF